MLKNLKSRFNDLNDVFADYLNIRVKLIKLNILEKMTKMSMFVINAVVMFILLTVFFFLISAAFIVWYGTTYGDYLTGIFIIIGVMVLFTIIFLLLRKTVITSAIIKQISAILFEEDDDTDKKSD